MRNYKENDNDDIWQSSPEKKLWAAVLTQAISDYQKRSKYRDELNFFFFGDGPLGKWFEQICEILDFTPDAVRAEIRKKKGNHDLDTLRRPE